MSSSIHAFRLLFPSNREYLQAPPWSYFSCPILLFADDLKYFLLSICLLISATFNQILTQYLSGAFNKLPFNVRKGYSLNTHPPDNRLSSYGQPLTHFFHFVDVAALPKCPFMDTHFLVILCNSLVRNILEYASLTRIVIAMQLNL